MTKNSAKTFERILYVASRQPGIPLLNLRAVLYFADLLSVRRIGRMIAEDSYLALLNGPLPVSLFLGIRNQELDDYLTIKDATVLPQRRPRTELLSRSDCIFLDRSLKKYGTLPPPNLKHYFSLDKTLNLSARSGETEIGVMEIAKSIDADGSLFLFSYVSRNH